MNKDDSKHIPRKRFGQHFLCDQGVIQQIVAALDPQPQQHLIEIGPGQGALTLPVIKRSKFLEAVELDKDLIPELQARTQHAGHLHIYSADVLDFDFASIKNDDRLLRVFGNLPYNISTPLIFHLIQYANIMSDMLFMLQKEVAERLAAPVNSPHYGRLSVMIQYHCHVDLLFNVSADSFYPPPKVESSIVRLLPRNPGSYLAKDYALFSELVKHAFGQRRKTLRNSLKSYIDPQSWQAIAVKPELRAENVSVSDFVEIANRLSEIKKA